MEVRSGCDPETESYHPSMVSASHGFVGEKGWTFDFGVFAENKHSVWIGFLTTLPHLSKNRRSQRHKRVPVF